MVQLFLGNRSIALLLLPLLIFVYSLSNAFFGNHSPLDFSFFGIWGKWSIEASLFSKIVGPLLVLVRAILINQLFNRFRFRERNTYIPALVYVVFQSFFRNFYMVDGFSIAQLFLVLALLQIFKLDQNSDGRKTVFNAAFFMGTAMTCYPSLLVCIPFLFAMIWVFRPFVLRESALAMLGIVTPFIYALAFVWLNGIDAHDISFSAASNEFALFNMYVVVAGTLTMILAGTGAFLHKVQQSSIQLKKQFRVLWLYVFSTCILLALEVLFLGKVETSALLYAAFVIFITYGFGDRKPRPVMAGIFYVILLFSLCKFFIPFIF